MNKSKAFRKNTITRLIAHAFPMALLFVPVMVNATTTVDKDTNSTYALMGDTEYIINPGVTMTGKRVKPASSP